MPTVDQILDGLHAITNRWQLVAALWHVYFGVLLAVVALGRRPSRRAMGVLLAAPFFSVSALAWGSANPFNGLVFAVVGVALALVATRLPRSEVALAPQRFMIPGALTFALGWLYPHFLEASSAWTYFHAAPTGLIPCPTLAIATGATLMLSSLGSRAYGVVLGTVGLFYGVTGVLQLGVMLDAVLMVGAAAVLVQAGRI